MSKLLLLSPIAPYPSDTGAAQRTFLLYQALRARHDVTLVLVNHRQYSEDQLKILRERFNFLGQVSPDGGRFPPRVWNFNIPLLGTPLRRLTRLVLGGRATLFSSPSMSANLAAMVAGKGFDAIVTRYLWTACQTNAFALGPVCVDVDDLPSEVWSSRSAAARAKGAISASCAQRIAVDYARRERDQLARCQGIWVAKEKDMAAAPDVKAALLPNIPFGAYPDGVRSLPSPSQSGVVLGVALFDWPPNKAGFDWYVRNVWPLVHRARPDATLHLVGKLSDADLKERWQSVPGVKILGRVEDLTAAYAGASLAIAPIFSGGGTNIKVVEALSFGRCCVVSPHAAKGFEQLLGLEVAQDAQSFASACLALLSDAPEAPVRAQQVSETANRHFSFAGFKRAVLDVMAAVPSDLGRK
ncbi:glycosyltransferase [Aquabacterium sp.]|uniref:glycosyltransferase n=1 Tax=Aquabacterium sp. TaxID=1872578 RepID=UPI0025B9FCED|nr:glycosyltransferase [Aquabacterium sp.]